MNPLNHRIIYHSDEFLAEYLLGYRLQDAEFSSAYRFLVAAYRHIDKQKWVAEVVANILETDLEELGRLGGFAHPEHIPQNGEVPNLPEWEYYFHGTGCCLTNKDGTEIDVDFPDGRYDVIDPYFFGNYLSSLHSLTVLESRLTSPKLLSNAWMAELPKLIELGLIKGEHKFELTDKGKLIAHERVHLWERLDTEDNHFARSHIALLLGDLLLARDYLTEVIASDSFDRVTLLANHFEEFHYNNLISSLKGKDEFQKKDIFKAAASINDASASKVVNYILREGKLSSSTFLALELIEQRGPEKYSIELEKLIKKAWRGKLPQPGIRVNASRLLMTIYSPKTLPVKLERKLLKALSKRLDRMTDEAAKLLYLIDDSSGLFLLNKCLESDIPIVRKGGAAALAFINTSEAISLLEKSNSITAATMLAIINNTELAKVIPLGSEVEIDNRKVRTYSFEELEMADMEDCLRSIYEDIAAEYLPLMKRWNKIA